MLYGSQPVMRTYRRRSNLKPSRRKGRPTYCWIIVCMPALTSCAAGMNVLLTCPLASSGVAKASSQAGGLTSPSPVPTCLAAHERYAFALCTGLRLGDEAARGSVLATVRMELPVAAIKGMHVNSARQTWVRGHLGDRQMVSRRGGCSKKCHHISPASNN